MRTVAFRSPLPLDVCVERLREQIRSQWMPFQAAPFVGRVTAQRLVVRRNHLFWHNSFQSWLIANVQPDGLQTLLSGRFRMALIVKSFMTLWFGILGLALVAAFIALLDHQSGATIAAASTVAMILFGFGLIRLAQFLSRNDESEIEEMLRKVIQAERLR